MAIYDTMRHIKAPVHTIGVGLAASMGSLLLASGNRRSVLPHTKVMIHQPLISGGIGGKETDIAIIAKDLSSTRHTMAEIMSKHTGMSIKKVERDIENDRYMDAKGALEYGICDDIIEIR
jgi:ATP-dependent Clp protease protease subunit